MTRQYRHRPDEVAVRRRRQQAEYLLATAQGTITAKGGSRAVDDTAVDAAWEGAACGWYLDEPAEQVLDVLARGAHVVAQVLPGSAPPFDSWSLGHWQSAIAVAGDAALLEACARTVLAPDTFQAEPPENAAHVTRAVAALLLGDTEQGLQLLTDGPAGVATGPMAAQAEQYDAMFRAIVRSDQAALDQAAHARYDARARLAGRSAENRRRWTFLLDRGGMTLMVAARRQGLTPTADIPDMPVELLARAVTS